MCNWTQTHRRMDPLFTPTTASSRAYQRLSFDAISITSSTTDEFSDTDSSIYNPNFASSETSFAYSERTINSRKSRYNAPPRHKYAERSNLPQGPAPEDVDGASVLEVCRTIRCQDGHTYISVIIDSIIFIVLGNPSSGCDDGLPRKARKSVRATTR